MTPQETKYISAMVKTIVGSLPKSLVEGRLTTRKMDSLMSTIVTLLKPLVEAHKWNKSNGRDYSKEKAYNNSPERRKYRAKLNKANRDRGTYGNSDGKDLHHAKGGKLVQEPSSKNKGRKEKSRAKGYNSK